MTRISCRIPSCGCYPWSFEPDCPYTILRCPRLSDLSIPPGRPNAETLKSASGETEAPPSGRGPRPILPPAASGSFKGGSTEAALQSCCCFAGLVLGWTARLQWTPSGLHGSGLQCQWAGASVHRHPPDDTVTGPDGALTHLTSPHFIPPHSTSHRSLLRRLLAF